MVTTENNSNQWNSRQHMVLDGVTLTNLDVVNNNSQSQAGTLLQRLDHCATPFGKCILKFWSTHCYDTYRQAKASRVGVCTIVQPCGHQPSAGCLGDTDKASISCCRNQRFHEGFARLAEIIKEVCLAIVAALTSCALAGCIRWGLLYVQLITLTTEPSCMRKRCTGIWYSVVTEGSHDTLTVNERSMISCH